MENFGAFNNTIPGPSFIRPITAKTITALNRKIVENIICLYILLLICSFDDQ